MINLDSSRSKLRDSTLAGCRDKVIKADKSLEDMTKRDGEMAGWIYLPEDIFKDPVKNKEFKRIKSAAKRIRQSSEVLVVIGIGGSYLGAKAVIDMFERRFEKRDVEIVFVGNNMSTRYINEVLDYVSGKDFSINVISKSGTTLEPSLAFRIFKNLAYEKYGIVKAKERIYVTTDKEDGALKALATEEGFETFVVPDDIGGRYSVLTAVGLLPIAAAGIDIDRLVNGAKTAVDKYLEEDLLENDAYKYATLRYLLNTQYGKDIEIIVSYEPNFRYFIEWIKQLFNESEGKDGKGLFTTGSINTTDLHSIGQNIQSGKRNIFETVLGVDDMKETDITVLNEEEDYDGLNYLAGKTIDYINKTALEATMNAHLEGDVPNIYISVKELSEEAIGELIYFYEKAAAMHCLLLGVNPFNQPGVENYKNNMFKMLGKP